MDPFSIVTAAFSLAGGIATTSMVIVEFARDTRDAAKDLEAVSSELQAVNAILTPLAEGLASANAGSVPDALIRNLDIALSKCAGVVEQIKENLQKYKSNTVFARAKWAFSGQGDMQKLRLSLEAFKTTLNIGLIMISASKIQAVKDDTELLREHAQTIMNNTEAILARMNDMPPTGKFSNSSQIENWIEEITALSSCDGTSYQDLTAFHPQESLPNPNIGLRPSSLDPNEAVLSPGVDAGPVNLPEDQLSQVAIRHRKLHTRFKDQVQDLCVMFPELAAPHDMNTGPKAWWLDDSGISARWGELSWMVRDVVQSVVNVQLPSRPKKTDNNQFSHFRQLTPDYTAFLGDERGRVFLAEAAIWRVLAQNVFAKSDEMGNTYWAGRYAKVLRPLSDTVFKGDGKDAVEFHRLRCDASRYLVSRAKPDEVAGHVWGLVEKIELTLRSLVADRQRGLRQALEKVIHCAISLDANLCQQPAWWYCWYPRTNQIDCYGVDFDEGSMEELRSSEARGRRVQRTPRVMLMVAPALVKAGDSRGLEFDFLQIIYKSSVVSGPPKMP